ncbi:MAG: dienelactone hydrolase family protein [Bacteroidetes bacterium]|nr:dienelactone hydrolase family protein [Bacteroidota bacterium]
MKKYLLILMMMYASTSIWAQPKMTACCSQNATEKFAALANNVTFVSLHEAPIPFTFHSEDGADIHFKTDDGTDAHAWMIKATKPTKYYILVIHEWWGLNDYIKQESEKLSHDLDINVIALDLYDNKVATTPDQARTLVQSVKTDRAISIIKGAYNFIGSDAKVFTIGWCFGGGWSLQSSLLGGSNAVGCIMYYGMPENDVNVLKTLHCDVIGFFANQDQGITPAIVDKFQENMKAADRHLTVYRYDAVHAFANPSNPNYNKEATEDAYTKTIAFIKERMKN